MKILKTTMAESRNCLNIGGAGREIGVGGEMTDGIVDRLLMRKEVLRLLVIMKICKSLSQSAKEIKSTKLFNLGY